MQSTILTKQAGGYAGQISKSATQYLNTIECVAVSSIDAGTFAQRGTNEGEATATAGVALSGQVLGVVVKDHFKNGETMGATYTAGDNVCIATRGSVWVSASGSATVGNCVMINDTTGAVTYSATNSGSGVTWSGWRVSVGGSASGDLIEITTAMN